MKEWITCKSGECTTWFNGSSVAFVDSWRKLQTFCKCEVDEWNVEDTIHFTAQRLLGRGLTVASSLKSKGSEKVPTPPLFSNATVAARGVNCEQWWKVRYLRTWRLSRFGTIHLRWLFSRVGSVGGWTIGLLLGLSGFECVFFDCWGWGYGPAPFFYAFWVH